VTPGSVPLILMSPGVAKERFDVSAPSTGAAHYLGFSIAVRSLDQLRQRFTRDGIAFKDTPKGTLSTGPDGLHGCLVEFVEE